MEKKYCYVKTEAADDGSILLEYEERVPYKPSGSSCFDSLSYRYEEHTLIYTAEKLSTDEGKIEFANKLIELATARL